MFGKLNNKGQTAIEYLLIIVGVLLLAIIVIYIIITTGSSSQKNADDSEERLGNIEEGAIFPPRIQSVTCDYNDTDPNTINLVLRIFESPTPNIDTYCLFLSGRDANLCSIYSGSTLNFDYDIASPAIVFDSNSLDITLIARFDENHFSSQSVSKSCVAR